MTQHHDFFFTFPTLLSKHHTHHPIYFNSFQFLYRCTEQKCLAVANKLNEIMTSYTECIVSFTCMYSILCCIVMLFSRLFMLLMLTRNMVYILPSLSELTLTGSKWSKVCIKVLLLEVRILLYSIFISVIDLLHVLESCVRHFN